MEKEAGGSKWGWKGTYLLLLKLPTISEGGGLEGNPSELAKESGIG